MKRLYNLAIPGTELHADMLICKVREAGLSLQGSHINAATGEACVQLLLESDEQALETAQQLLPGYPWRVHTGYGIHRRIVLPPQAAGTL